MNSGYPINLPPDLNDLNIWESFWVEMDQVQPFDVQPILDESEPSLDASEPSSDSEADEPILEPPAKRARLITASSWISPQDAESSSESEGIAQSRTTTPIELSSEIPPALPSPSIGQRIRELKRDPASASIVDCFKATKPASPERKQAPLSRKRARDSETSTPVPQQEEVRNPRPSHTEMSPREIVLLELRGMLNYEKQSLELKIREAEAGKSDFTSEALKIYQQIQQIDAEKSDLKAQIDQAHQRIQLLVAQKAALLQQIPGMRSSEERLQQLKAERDALAERVASLF